MIFTMIQDFFLRICLHIFTKYMINLKAAYALTAGNTSYTWDLFRDYDIYKVIELPVIVTRFFYSSPFASVSKHLALLSELCFFIA